MKAILVTVDDSIEVIELQNGEESIKEIVGEKFDQFDLFNEDGSGVYLYGSTDEKAQSKLNKLATLIWTDFLNGKKERAYEENAVKKLIETIENSFNKEYPEGIDEETRKELEARKKMIKKDLVASLRYQLRTAIGDELYGNVVICMENKDLPGDIIQKIMDVASQYTDKCPAIEKPVE